MYRLLSALIVLSLITGCSLTASIQDNAQPALTNLEIDSPTPTTSPQNVRADSFAPDVNPLTGLPVALDATRPQSAASGRRRFDTPFHRRPERTGMDAKRELSSIDLSALVQELNRYEGAKVDKAYLYGDDLLRLRMRDFDRGRVELIVEVGDVKRAHVADPEHVPDAPGRPPNFAMMLRNRLSGADFAGVEQYGFDRILQFHFERGDEDTTIVAELFGQGNIAVRIENYIPPEKEDD